MSQPTFEAGATALVVIDPYNDFISEGGKVWDRLKGVAGANDCVPHMLQVLNAARKASCACSLRCTGDTVLATTSSGTMWRRFRRPPGRGGPSSTARGATRSQRVRAATGEIVALEHWCSAGSPARTWICSQEARYQKAHRHWDLAYACVEATVRFAAELG